MILNEYKIHTNYFLIKFITLTKCKNIRKSIFYIAKKYLYLKEKNCFVHVFSSFGNL